MKDGSIVVNVNFNQSSTIQGTIFFHRKQWRLFHTEIKLYEMHINYLATIMGVQENPFFNIYIWDVFL